MSLTAALRRLGYGPDEVVVHGFRKTFKTLLAGSERWPREWIELQLAHKLAGLEGVYNCGSYWSNPETGEPQRPRMMAWWGDYLDSLKAGAVV